jgi:Flp pilus assembly protein TadG
MKRTISRRQHRRGSAIVEFAIAGIAGATLILSIVQLGLAMWNYHTLAYAVHETNRYIASHGRSCSTGGNGCTITVGNIATKLATYAVGIPSSKMNMTLTSQSGTAYPCNPVSSCASDSTQWPPVAHLDNNPGNYTKITANTTLNVAIIEIWFGATARTMNSLTLAATSNIPIVF